MLQDIVIQPDPTSWPTVARTRPSGKLFYIPLESWRERTHDALFGTRPTAVIATGHQAGFEHPGIIAKYDALHAIVHEINGARALELVVDQDINDPLALSVPVVNADGHIEAKTVRLGGVPDDDRIVARREVVTDLSVPSLDWLDPAFAMRLHEAVDALNLTADQDSLALQVAKADEVLRGRCVECEHPTRIGASTLVQTEAWSALLHMVRDNPAKMRETYNAAVARFPDTDVTMLEPDELPLWIVSERGHRRRATDADLAADIPSHRIFPRALVMTGFMRAVIADLFIHGLGGARYDRITDLWFKSWLGISLTPIVTVTATMTLRADGMTATSQSDLDRAESRARWLHYNLDRALNDPALQAIKTEHLRTIDAAPRKSRARHAAFEAMRQWQSQIAREHPDVVRQAEAHLDAVRRDLSRAEALNQRTWPALLFPPDALRQLSDAVHAAFAPVASPPCSA